MANLEQVNVLIPETHSISQHLRVVSNYNITKQVNDKGEIIRLTRTFEVAVAGGDILSFSQIIPKNNDQAKAAILGIHSGDSFRIGHMGITPAKDGGTSPSGMPAKNRAVKGYFNSPIILWNTFVAGDAGALYEGVTFPDLSDRAIPSEREVNWSKKSDALVPVADPSTDVDIPY